MAATDGQIVIAGARWNAEEILTLNDCLIEKDDKIKSELIKFVRGQYSTLGVPNLPNPSLHSHAVLSSLGKSVKVAAQSVKFKDGKKHVSTNGIRFSIPVNYNGYFEILSEEGKAVKCIESVHELSKKFPESVLVRENIRGFVSNTPLLELSSDKSRAINTGEILTLQHEVRLIKSSRNYRFLQCTNLKQEYVYLNLDQRGKFSPLARNENISGVHTLKQLISNKRLPLMVRLVYGQLPNKNGSSNSTVPCSELRLISTFEEESIFALPVGQHHQNNFNIVSLPLSCNLKFIKAKLSSNCLENFQRLSSISVKLAKEQISKITVLDTTSSIVSSFWNISPNFTKHHQSKSIKNNFIRRSSSLEIQNNSGGENEVETAPTADFLEIDQIYDYVRGFAPLPKNLKSINFEEVEDKPIPPPIETIPSPNKQQIIIEHKTTINNNNNIKSNSNNKMKSKTALKLELHAQNIAKDTKRKKPSSLMLTTRTCSIDLSNTRVLTQDDLVPASAPIKLDNNEPTYENLDEHNKEKAASEIAIKNHYSKRNNYNKFNKLISPLHKAHHTKAVKSHEDIALLKKSKSISSDMKRSSLDNKYKRQSSLNSLQHYSNNTENTSNTSSPNPSSPTVIEHKAIEVNLSLSKPNSTRRSSRTMKLGILYL